ncbi:hypothetical protein IQ273_28035 [Nodosilinea sp. LEGE 07298]|jgi:hypothetical protein|uniref:hypothetical protein n=1 Tax=Nodosilinea sp. LEGE 07298 TaxID=2777970 RepID=UPI00187F1790|nr:hypothetical protein [Nodosilinea sp. LEGE 07298]MBE9113235.1 hypothetical protein [Nodosilinea sp. LEGE 07298]
MLLLILTIVIALVAWALRLMEQAVKGQEFSLMLAGFLVASSAAALMGVYFLMGNYMLYMNSSAQQMSAMESLDIPYSIYASATVPDSTNPGADWLTQAEWSPQ